MHSHHHPPSFVSLSWSSILNHSPAPHPTENSSSFFFLDPASVSFPHTRERREATPRPSRTRGVSRRGERSTCADPTTEMARGAAEPSAKRAKVDEADNEEDLVRRKEEVVRLLERARKGKDLSSHARAKKELMDLCARLEAKNEERLRRLPPELWEKIDLQQNVQQNDVLALAMTCRFFRDTTKEEGRELKTSVTRDSTSHSLDWYRFADDFPEILPGCLEWVRAQDPPHRWDVMTCEEAAREGDLELLEWLRAQNPPCPWDHMTCAGAAEGGHLDVLRWVRAQDPPCPWDAETCYWAAAGGHLDVLMWVRSRNPPCPWDVGTCAEAAFGRRLDMLKWARSQNPPCPWDAWTCEGATRGGHLDILEWLRAQGPRQETPNLPEARRKTSPHKYARAIFLEVGQVFRLTAELRKRMIPVESWFILRTIGKSVPLYTRIR